MLIPTLGPVFQLELVSHSSNPVDQKIEPRRPQLHLFCKSLPKFVYEAFRRQILSQTRKRVRITKMLEISEKY